ncbi:MAG: hypothetical protein ABI663_06070 [Chryseolinea sp.]
MKSVRFIVILTGLISFSFLTETWYSLESTDFGFKVLLPKEPVAQNQVVPSAIGELKMNLYILDTSADEAEDNLLYLVNYTEYPDSLFANATEEKFTQILRGSVDGMVTNVGGKLLSEKVIILNGSPGREVKVSFQEGAAVINARVYLVRNKMYLLETISFPQKDSNQSIDKFFNSFQLL